MVTVGMGMIVLLATVPVIYGMYQIWKDDHVAFWFLLGVFVYVGIALALVCFGSR